MLACDGGPCVCAGISYELLNAKPENVQREAEIVAQSGRRGAVTISTNMAGRGTDILLGGNPEYMAKVCSSIASSCACSTCAAIWALSEYHSGTLHGSMRVWAIVQDIPVDGEC